MMRCASPPHGCGKPANRFRDLLSLKEFKLSGLCQACQDDFFCDMYKPGVLVCKKPCCQDTRQKGFGEEDKCEP